MHSLTTEISLIQSAKSRNDGLRKKDGKKSPQTGWPLPDNNNKVHETLPE